MENVKIRLGAWLLAWKLPSKQQAVVAGGAEFHKYPATLVMPYSFKQSHVLLMCVHQRDTSGSLWCLLKSFTQIGTQMIFSWLVFMKCSLKCGGGPFPSQPSQQRGHAPHKTQSLGFACKQLPTRVNRNPSKHKLSVCFLCLEKYGVCSPNRGILWHESSFAFASQKL